LVKVIKKDVRPDLIEISKTDLRRQEGAYLKSCLKPMINSSERNQTHFSGWLTPAGAMPAYGGICGDVTYAYGVFLSSMNETFGWNPSALSGPYTHCPSICLFITIL
jgi:hypothetical protein